jgi:hypothetical protein
VGRASNAVSCTKFPRFRCGQQPKLRECFGLSFLVFRFCFSLNGGAYGGGCRDAITEFSPRGLCGGFSPLSLLCRNRWHVGCGAMGFWAQHRRFARNETKWNDVPEKPRH